MAAAKPRARYRLTVSYRKRNPVVKQAARGAGAAPARGPVSGRSRNWTLADLLVWTEESARAMTAAERRESDRGWAVLRRAGLV